MGKLDTVKSAYGRRRKQNSADRRNAYNQNMPLLLGDFVGSIADRRGRIADVLQEWVDLQGAVPFPTGLHNSKNKVMGVAASVLCLGPWHWRILQILHLVTVVARNEDEEWVNAFTVHSMLGYYWCDEPDWHRVSMDITDYIKAVVDTEIAETMTVKQDTFVRLLIPYDKLSLAIVRQIEHDMLGVLHPNCRPRGYEEVLQNRTVLSLVVDPTDT